MRFISFGILVSGILLIRKLMWKHISRKTQYAFWIFPALFLLLNPFWDISSKWSIENILFTFEQRTLQETEKYFPQLWSEPDSFGENADKHIESKQNNGDTERQNETDQEEILEKYWNTDLQYNEEKTDSRYVLTIFLNAITHFMQKNWSSFRRIISFILFLGIGYSNIKFYRFCLKNRKFFRNEKKVKVYFLEGIGSPFLLGTDIYIDKNSIENETVLKHVIMHEYCHYKHKDYVWIILRTVCLIFYWYHPFVWLANEYAKRDCELACDEAVMLGLDSKEHEEYGYTLISVLKHSRIGKRYTAISSAANQNMKKIKERLIMIKATEKCSKAVSAICIMCIVILTGCTFAQKPVREEETSEKKQIVENQEISDFQLQDINIEESIKKESVQIAENTMIGPYFPSLDYADESMIIFHSYFGIFIYDLKEKCIVSSMDLDSLKMADSSVSVKVNEEGTDIYIMSDNSDFAFCWNISSDSLQKKHVPEDERFFTKFVDNLEIEKEQREYTFASFLYSDKAVVFEDGSYGRLYNPGYYVKDIMYIRNDQKWNIFENEKKDDLWIKQKDTYYELFKEEAQKSKRDLYEYYSFMLSRTDYAGLCSLSQGVIYSDEKQSKMSAYNLVTAGEEINSDDNKGCFKIYITVTNWEELGMEHKEYVKYLYVKNDGTGWFADGFLQDTVPSDEWWGDTER